MNKYKITLFGSHFAPRGGGGITTSHSNLFYAFQNLGHDTTYIAFQENDPSIKKNNPINVFQYGSPLLFLKTIKALLKIFFRIFEKFDRSYQTADILHSTWGALESQKKLNGLQSDFWILPDQSTPLPLLKLTKNTKVIYYVHHHAPRFLKLDTTAIYSKLDTHFAVKIEKKLLEKKVHAVVCPSQSQKEFFLKTHPEIKEIFVIPNLLNTKLIQNIEISHLKKLLHLNDDELLIYIPGASNPLKGSQLLPDILTQFSLLLKKSSYKRKIGFYCGGGLSKKMTLELQNIHNNFIFFTEKLSYSEHLKNVKACDFGFSPTLMESFGMALLEALCLSTPMIAFDREATREVILHGQNGCLTPFMDIEKLCLNLSEWVLHPEKIPNSKNHLGVPLLQEHEIQTLEKWTALFNKLK